MAAITICTEWTELTILVSGIQHVVEFLCCVWLFATPWTAACQASLSFIISWSLPKLMSIELVMPFNHLILCVPFSSCLLSFPVSGSFPALCIRWPKLNKQGDNIQPWRTPFPIWNQSVVPCPVLTVASWPAYRFLERQVTMVWSLT